MLHDKIKKTVKKATKKVKKGLGSLANKVADKLVPKELAPFLPMLAPLFMGPGAGLLSRYLAPQLLTALASGKQTGDIDLTSQALTGIASALSDPNRLKLSTETPATTKTIQGATEIDPDLLDPSFLESDLVDPSLRGDFSQQVAPDLDFGKMAPAGSRRSIYDATGGGLRLSPAVTKTGPIIVDVPAGGSPFAVPGQPTFAEFKDLSFGDQLRTIVNESRDFIQGTNVANRGPFGDQVTVGADSDLIGQGRFNPNTQTFADFQANPANVYAAGDPVLVRDAGFGANFPRRAVQQGILSAGPVMASIEKSEEEQAAMLAEQQAEQQAALDARDALTDFYFGLADPQNRFGTLPIFAAEGGNVDSKRGLVDGPGGYAGHDDIDDIIRKLMEDMAIDFSKAGGGNPPSIVGGTDFKKRKLPKGMKVIRSIKPKKAEGGIMNAAPGMPQGMQVDGRNGTFIPMGVEEKADDVPAMLSKNEFVMTADAVRAAGGGSVEKGAQRMYDLMNSLEARG